MSQPAVPIDRAATLKTAEKLIRQGRLEGAIQEYVRLVDDQPRDWNAINALGDLYARAGNVQQAVAQFTRIADYLFEEGFFPKAAALYKKAIKAQPEHEPSLMRLGEIAVRQGLVADARLYWGQLAELRRRRGDDRGAGECAIALGALDDPDLKLAAARAARAVDGRKAAALFRDAAGAFDTRGRGADALDALVEAAQSSPDDATLRGDVAGRCLVAGDVERAGQFLNRDTAGGNPDLLFALGRIELARDREHDLRTTFLRLLAVAPERARDIIDTAAVLAEEGKAGAAFACVEVVAETALRAGDLEAAVAALQAVLQHPPYIPALVKLVEVAIDAGRDDVMRSAQEQLTGAYLDAGRAAEARVVAEDLVTHDPARTENVQRLRRALVLAGVPDPDSVIAHHLECRHAPGDTLDFGDVPMAIEGVPATSIRTPEPLPPGAALGPPGEQPAFPPTQPPDGEAVPVEDVEIDLSDALSRLGSKPVLVPPPPSIDAAAQRPRDLDEIFAEMRAHVRAHEGTAPAAQLQRGLAYLEEGRIAEAIVDLQAAARTPMLRFPAAAALGRIHASRGEMGAAVEWLERAVEAPAPSDEESVDVLYELADLLERTGDSTRALAILMEIDADVAAYRDVRARIEKMTRARAGGGS